MEGRGVESAPELVDFSLDEEGFSSRTVCESSDVIDGVEETW